jgi:hypothetical protein
MAEKNPTEKKLSKTNTKQEMLDSYNALLQQLQEKERTDVKPQIEQEKKKSKEIIAMADSLSSEGVLQEISTLRVEMGKVLSQLTDKLDGEVHKYRNIKEAIELREKELKEIYDIEKESQTLAALIEAQAQEREEFEEQMKIRKDELEKEMQLMRDEWGNEKKVHEVKIKERDADDLKVQQRAREEFEYTFKREKQLAKNQFEDEKAKEEREMQIKREDMEKQLLERQQNIAVNESRLNKLQELVDNFPKELEASVSKAIKETKEKVSVEANTREELAKRIFEGERNVLNATIEALERTTKEQKDQIVRLSQQLEKAYQKIEDIAVKTTGGSFDLKSVITEEVKKQIQEK